jgi:MFS family permease
MAKTEVLAHDLLENKELELPQHFRWNYLMHIVEGGLCIGGIAFVAPSTVLPKVVDSLGGPPWLISLMPIMMMVGFVWPPLFTAHWVERLHRVKPAVLVSGLLQRIPYLVAGVVLLGFSGDSPKLALAAVALAPFVSGLFGGLTMTAWLELVSKTIPDNRRSSVWAMRFIIASLIGIVAGGVIAGTLARFPGMKGYGILHLIAFGLQFVSYLLFATIRETSVSIQAKSSNSSNLGQNLRSVPALLWNDKRLCSYIISRSFMNGIFIMTPFLTIHALKVLGRPESYLGYMVTAQMVGGIFGNLVAGPLGDRYGGKLPMMLGRVAFVILSIWSCFAKSEFEFAGILFLFGAALFCNQVGTTTLSIEISPPERRATYLAIMSTLTMPTTLIASVVCTVLWNLTGSFPGLAGATAACVFLSILFLVRIEEPRGHRATRLQ